MQITNERSDYRLRRSLGCERMASLTALRSKLHRMVEECACGRVSDTIMAACTTSDG
jgi:hypothetical protein